MMDELWFGLLDELDGVVDGKSVVNADNIVCNSFVSRQHLMEVNEIALTSHLRKAILRQTRSMVSV